LFHVEQFVGVGVGVRVVMFLTQGGREAEDEDAEID
jgi:hypothetical protein